MYAPSSRYPSRIFDWYKINLLISTFVRTRIQNFLFIGFLSTNRKFCIHFTMYTFIQSGYKQQVLYQSKSLKSTWDDNAYTKIYRCFYWNIGTYFFTSFFHIAHTISVLGGKIWIKPNTIILYDQLVCILIRHKKADINKKVALACFAYYSISLDKIKLTFVKSIHFGFDMDDSNSKMQGHTCIRKTKQQSLWSTTVWCRSDHKKDWSKIITVCIGY